jgi:hypothetical protein
MLLQRLKDKDQYERYSRDFAMISKGDMEYTLGEQLLKETNIVRESLANLRCEDAIVDIEALNYLEEAILGLDFPKWLKNQTVQQDDHNDPQFDSAQ